MFQHVPAYPGDPILGLMAAFLSDTRARKANLGVGIYYDEEGKVPVLRCVQTAEARIARQGLPKA